MNYAENYEKAFMLDFDRRLRRLEEAQREAEALDELRRQVTAPALPRVLVPVYDALRDLRDELSLQGPAILHDIIDRAEKYLDVALPHFRPQDPSQPPGATISPNQGVGMGEGEKVAQDGAEGLRVGRISFSPTPSHGTIPPYPEDQLRDLRGGVPCPPAPPPCAEPAEETSSGREGCGEGTAGGAGGCCEEMDYSAWSPGIVRAARLRFCPWCASPLREDGELRVGERSERA